MPEFKAKLTNFALTEIAQKHWSKMKGNPEGLRRYYFGKIAQLFFVPNYIVSLPRK